MEFLKAQYYGRYFSCFICYPWEISLGNTGLAFTVMLMILSSIFLHGLVKHTKLRKLMECIVDIKNWMTSNFLLLNSEKTEVLIIGPKTPTSNNLEHCLTLDGCSVNSSSSVRNLGVLFNSNLSFDSHVSSICKTAFFHLKNISKLRPMLSMSNAEILIHAFMTSRLDYCNALLGGCSARLINKLQMVQNAAARVLTRVLISPVLHWLPTKHRIDFKILLITYKARMVSSSVLERALIAL